MYSPHLHWLLSHAVCVCLSVCLSVCVQVFEDWKKKAESRQNVIQGRIFAIVSQRTRTGSILRLQVNFAPDTITLAKEVSVQPQGGERS